MTPAYGRGAAELTAAECADIVGVARSTWTAYVARGQAPAPDRHVGRTPLWREASVREWVASRTLRRELEE